MRESTDKGAFCFCHKLKKDVRKRKAQRRPMHQAAEEESSFISRRRSCFTPCSWPWVASKLPSHKNTLNGIFQKLFYQVVTAKAKLGTFCLQQRQFESFFTRKIVNERLRSPFRDVISFLNWTNCNIALSFFFVACWNLVIRALLKMQIPPGINKAFWFIWWAKWGG